MENPGSSHKKSKIVASAIVLLVADVQVSAAYYRDALGFEFDRFWGEPPGFCMTWRDKHCVMLSQVGNAGDIRPISSVKTDIWDGYFWVDDADALYEEVVAKGAKIKHEPVVKFYGVKEFCVIDPDGYQMAFGQDLG